MKRNPANPLLWLLLAAAIGWSHSAAADDLPTTAHADHDTVSATSSTALDDSVATAGHDEDAAAAAPATEVSPNARLVSQGKRVRLHRQDRNVVRFGPGDRFAVVSVQPRGATFPVIAKNGDWYNVRLSETQSGWIHSSLCEELDDLSTLEFRPNPKLYSRTGSFVVAGYSGAYAFDRKSNALVLGGRLGYYVFDWVQVEGGMGWTHIRRPAEIIESLFDLKLEAEDFHMLFYQMNVTIELLPGRQMVPFVTAGVGSAIMQGDTEPSLNFGAGTTLYLSKRTAMRWEVRDYQFDSGPEDARRSNDNIEFTLGAQYLF